MPLLQHYSQERYPSGRIKEQPSPFHDMDVKILLTRYQNLQGEKEEGSMESRSQQNECLQMALAGNKQKGSGVCSKVLNSLVQKIYWSCSWPQSYVCQRF